MPARDGFWRSGDAGVWLTAGATATALLLILGVFGLVAAGGLGFFWPQDLVRYDLSDGRTLLGLRWAEEPMPADLAAHPGERRIEIMNGNRDVDSADEFAWVAESAIRQRSKPIDAFVIERLEYGAFHGFLEGYRLADGTVFTGPEATVQFRARRPLIERERATKRRLERREIPHLHRALEEARTDPRRRDWIVDGLEARVVETEARIQELRTRLDDERLLLRTVGGEPLELAAGQVVRAFAPNRLGMPGKFGIYAARFWEFVSAEPREANMQGGVFPAIFGTVMMVFLMTLFVIPLGVTAALYLREYARQGTVVRTVRIAVNNLAGIPSIVFGIFGLGFFVYFVGGSIDRLFFSGALPTPTFGTGGILWSSLTLALLTLPVVIVATEEGLAAVPRATREGSLALGATKWETMWRVVLPAASPGILTGVILAMARAAGEVAPLMLTGAVKIAPELPLSGEFPFLHVERKFMHLGFHIYDIGFQSPNVEAAKPMVYMTTLLLVTLVVALNLVAMTIRNRIRSRHQSGMF